MCGLYFENWDNFVIRFGFWVRVVFFVNFFGGVGKNKVVDFYKEN